MKKTRFIPYGYTMRNGRTVIEHGEADIIRYIFDEYIKGASLKDLAEELTARKVPYTEKTEVWDKARIARIIDNAKYTGSEIYDPIIDEDTFEEAAAAKAARLRNQTVSECEGITLMRDRIRCGQCGAPMVRQICSKRKVKESWTCTNDACGCRVRISDTDLLMKVTLLMNRVIENADLMVPKPRKRAKDSPAVQRLQNEIDIELSADQPSEKFIASRICEIASQLYKETNAKEQIAARIAQKRVMLMNPQTEFNSVYFTDLVENVILEAPARVSLLTKTDVQISEGVLATSKMTLPGRTWEHLNVWDCPYKMKFDAAEVSQIIIRYDGMYRRCIRAKFTDLCYEGTKGEWRPVGSVLFGNASVIEFNSDTGSFENLLYVQEDVSDTKEQLETKLDNPDEIILDRICDEVFGDG